MAQKLSLTGYVEDFLTASSASDADSCFYIYDLIAEKLQQYSFRSSNSKPCSVGWDDEEPRLIACETSTVSNFVRKSASHFCSVVMYLDLPVLTFLSSL